MRKKKWVARCLARLVLVCLLLVFLPCCDSKVGNDVAEKDQKGRYLTVINNTDSIWNEVHVFVGEGTEIESMKEINPNEASFSLKVPEGYVDFDTFSIVAIDKYGAKYHKTAQNVKGTGRTEISITRENRVGEAGFREKISRWLNGD